MILLGIGLLLVGLFIPLFYRDAIIRLRPLYLLLLAIPLPFVAAIFGWLIREGGRQPCVAYGLLPPSRRSPRSAPADATSLIGFSLLLGTLAVTDWVLLARYAARGAATRRSAAPAPPDEPAHPEPALV